LDALRKAKLTGSVRDAALLVLGAWLLALSAALPQLQQLIMVGIGAALSLSEAVILVMRSVRSYRSGSEL
jgi:hypothetical protein